MDSKKTSLLLLGLSLAAQSPPLLAADIVNGWECTRTPAGQWDCGAAPAGSANSPVAKPPAAVPPQAPAEAAGPAAEAPTAAASPAPAEPAPVEQVPTEAADPVAEAPQEAPAPAATPTPAEPAPVVEAPAEAAGPVAEAPQEAPAPAATPAPVEQAPAEAAGPVAEAPQEAPASQLAVQPLVNPARSADSRGDFSLCGTPPRPEVIPTDAASRRNTAMNVNADKADVSQTGVSIFTGKVEVERADQHLNADRLEYNRDTEQAIASGHVTYQDNNIELKGPEITMDLIRDTGNIKQVEYQLYDRHASGKADNVDRDNVANITRLDNTTYSTCNAGNTDWQLRADKIELDHDEGFGTARNVSVNFMGVPFFYSPWMTFPINDDRKSGLLTPSLGNSDTSGTEIVVPYYWNISPNRDATITPRLLSKRGLQLNAEYRYLQENSTGQINVEALPNDNEYNDDRLLFAYKHQNRFAQRWATDVNYNYVSDTSYFQDLGSDLSLNNSTHLERRLDLTYQGDSWNVLGRLHDFQTISSTAVDQYARLPQILYNMYLPDNAFGIDYGLRAEAVAFDRDNSVTGTRFDIEPSISKPFRNNWGYVTPKLGIRHTSYNLNNNAIGTDDSPTRTTPIFSIDSGLFFERDASLGDTALIQTLEPRAYYLRIPKRNQDRLIVDQAGNDVVFDTGEYDFSFSQLFRENRFTGADRVNDADQLTLAVTSRLIDPGSGIERASASLGQIFYFRDRDVTLPNTIAENDSSSAIVAELNARFSQAWSARAGIQYDHHDEQTDKSVFNVRYQPDAKRTVNLGFRRRRADIEQTDVSFSWPLSRQFNAVGRWNYSLDQDRTIDGFAGIEYESCCWIARLVAREYVNDLNDTDKNTAIMLQLELKGLTSFGDGVKTFLERGILGYGRDDPYNEL